MNDVKGLGIFCCGCALAALAGAAAQGGGTNDVDAARNLARPPAAQPVSAPVQPAAKEAKTPAVVPDNLATGDPALDRILKQICDHNPGERERLLQLRQTDAAAFRAELNWRKKKLGEAMSDPEMKKVYFHLCELSQKHRAATNDDDRAKIKEQIRACVSRAAELQEQNRQREVQRMEQKLVEIKNRLTADRTNRTAIIERDVKEWLVSYDRLVPPRTPPPAKGK